MKIFLSLTFFAAITVLFANADELPTTGFRAVSGGASPDGRWLITVLDSSGKEYVDQLPESHDFPYLIDLDTLKPVGRIEDVTTLGGYHGRPETNVTAKWFPDSKYVSISWRLGRMNHTFRIFAISETGTLEAQSLSDPVKKEDSLLQILKPNSNSGIYLDSITSEGKLVVVYYGFWPKEPSYLETEAGKTFDHNRIEVIYSKDGDGWSVETIASPGTHGQ